MHPVEAAPAVNLMALLGQNPLRPAGAVKHGGLGAQASVGTICVA